MNKISISINSRDRTNYTLKFDDKATYFKEGDKVKQEGIENISLSEVNILNDVIKTCHSILDEPYPPNWENIVMKHIRECKKPPKTLAQVFESFIRDENYIDILLEKDKQGAYKAHIKIKPENEISKIVALKIAEALIISIDENKSK